MDTFKIFTLRGAILSELNLVDKWHQRLQDQMDDEAGVRAFINMINNPENSELPNIQYIKAGVQKVVDKADASKMFREALETFKKNMPLLSRYEEEYCRMCLSGIVSADLPEMYHGLLISKIKSQSGHIL